MQTVSADPGEAGGWSAWSARVCRACLRPAPPPARMTPLLQRCVATRALRLTPHARALTALAALTIDVNDGLPRQICPKCLHLLKQAIYFKFKCERTHQQLNTLTKMKHHYKTNIVEFSMFTHYFPSYGTTRLNNTPAEISRNVGLKINPVLNVNAPKIVLQVENNFHKNSFKHDDESISESSDHRQNYTSDVQTNGDINKNAKAKVFEYADEKWLYEKMLARYKAGYKHSSRPREATKKKTRPTKYVPTKSQVSKRFETNLRRAHEEKRLMSRELQSDLLRGKFLIDKRRPLKEESSTCQVCQKKFSSRSGLKLHSQQHYGYQFICEHCGKSVATQSSLDSHLMNRHGLQKRHSCQLCAFKAVHRFEIKEHMRTHTGERPFTCDKCGLTFRRRAIWKKHQYQHGERTFKCAQCPRSFFLRSDLAEHSNNMHERRYLYRCGEPGCGATYAKTSTVRRHLTSAHGIPRAQQGKILRVNVDVVRAS